MKFPQHIYVSHYGHSTEESPSLNACIEKSEAIEGSGPTEVATYILQSVSKVTKTFTEEQIDF